MSDEGNVIVHRYEDGSALLQVATADCIQEWIVHPDGHRELTSHVWLGVEGGDAPAVTP